MIAAAFALLIPAAKARGQYLPGYVVKALDSALASIAMRRDDLGMRWDAVADDPHRLQVIKRLFGDPLASFSVADSLASAGLSDVRHPRQLFTTALGLLDLDPDNAAASRPLPSDKDLRLVTGVDFDSLGFTVNILLRRFLSLAVATDATTISVRGAIAPDRLARIVDYCDSLLLQSEGDGEASPVDMRLAERYSIQRNKQHFNVDLAGLDYGRLAAPGITQFLMALDIAHGMENEVAKYRDTLKTVILNTPLGRVALGGGKDDYYEGDFFLIVDLGGNDVYKPLGRTKQEAFDHPVTMIVDFSGDDTYIGGDYSIGGALFGASTLIDLDGDDDYSAGNIALGAGLFGTSVLYDGSGSDRYTGGTFVEGAGAFGIGLLIDVEGNDLYHAHLTSQGFGYTRGIGMIVDAIGNDQYIAASPYTDYLRYDDHFETFCQGAALGARPVASAGIGIIAEGGGSDLYSADIFGQGTGYWFGLGAIVDRTGNDIYSAFQYAQGSGVHLAFGVLIDTAGNDNYISHGVSQGCGHDIAFGGLYDAKGDDNYVVESLSLGGGNADAVSLFVDAGGEDGYLARRDNTLGYSDLRREYGMIGVFLDLERRDYYGTSRGGNDSLWTGSYYGVGIDGEIRPADSTPPPAPGGGPQKTPEEIEKELATDIPTLFIQGSAAPQKYQYLVDPARKRLIDMADSSLPYLLTMLNTESPREALALGIILPKIGSRARPFLIDTVLRGDPSRVGRAIYALGEMKDTLAAEAIASRLVDTVASWRLRGVAGEAILKIRSRAVIDQLRAAMRDTVELIRGYATRAFVMIADSAEILEGLRMLSDPSQIVRYQYQLALMRRNIDSIPGPFASAVMAAPNGFPHQLMISLARSMKTSAGRTILLTTMLNSTRNQYRSEAIDLAAGWGDTTSRGVLEAHRVRESDADLARRIDLLLMAEPVRETAPTEVPRSNRSPSSPKKPASTKGTTKKSSARSDRDGAKPKRKKRK